MISWKSKKTINLFCMWINSCLQPKVALLTLSVMVSPTDSILYCTVLYTRLLLFSMLVCKYTNNSLSFFFTFKERLGFGTSIHPSIHWPLSCCNGIGYTQNIVLFGGCLTDLFYVVIRVRGDPEKVRPVFHPATYNCDIWHGHVFGIWNGVFCIWCLGQGFGILGGVFGIWDGVIGIWDGGFFIQGYLYGIVNDILGI